MSRPPNCIGEGFPTKHDWWGIIVAVIILVVVIITATYRASRVTEALEKAIAENNQKLSNQLVVDIRAAMLEAPGKLVIIHEQAKPLEETAETYVVSSLRDLDDMACMAMVKFDLKPSYMAKIQKSVRKYSAYFKLPEDLVYAVIEKESGFDQYEKSYADCFGLMQINLAVWQQELPQITSEVYLYDIDNNIKCGCYILSKYTKIAGIEYPAHDEEEIYREALKAYFGKCQQAERYAHKVFKIRTKYQAIKQEE